jgi:hypothetical protein
MTGSVLVDHARPGTALPLFAPVILVAATGILIFLAFTSSPPCCATGTKAPSGASAEGSSLTRAAHQQQPRRMAPPAREPRVLTALGRARARLGNRNDW